jgi:DNA-binding MarR family transcriptional regulator
MTSPSKNPPSTAMTGYLPHYLSRLMNALNLQLAEVLRPMELTPQQYRVLQVVWSRNEPCSIGAIWRDAVIEQSVVSRIVDQLERRGFVLRRKRPSNARMVEVSLTAVGRAVYDSLRPEVLGIVDHATSVLKVSEAEALIELLAKVFSHLQDDGKDNVNRGDRDHPRRVARKSGLPRKKKAGA